MSTVADNKKSEVRSLYKTNNNKPSNTSVAAQPSTKPEATPSKTPATGTPSSKPSKTATKAPSTKPSKTDSKAPSKKPSTTSKVPPNAKAKPVDGKKKKCCSCCKTHPGVCKCWHPCSFCLYPILLIGLAVLGYELYVVINYFLYVNQKPEVIIIVITALSVSTIFFFFLLLQLVYFLIYYESVRCTGIILFVIFFLVTFILGAGVFTISFLCNNYCPYGDDVVDVEVLSSGDTVSYVHTLRLISIVDLIIILLVMHSYFYHCHGYRQDMKNMQEQEKLNRSLSERMPHRSDKHPASPAAPRAQSNDPKVNIFYVQI